VTLTRKISQPLGRSTVGRLLKSYLSWHLVINDSEIILQAIEIEKDHKISFWDALIVSAAFSQNSTTILTEDLNHGQYFEGILIINPFI